MRNILHLINDSSVERGGAQKVLAKLNSIEEEKLNIESNVFSKSWVCEQHAASQIKGGPFWLLTLFILIIKTKPSVVVIHSRLYLPLVFFIKLFKCHVIYYSHAQYRKAPYLFRVFSCDQYVAVSDSVKKYLAKYVSSGLITVNFNSIDREFPARREPLANITFNYVGSLQSWKGIDLFLEYLNTYASKNKKRIDVNIVGEGPLRSYLDSLQLSEFVHIGILGYCANPYDSLNLSAVQVVPSLEEGFGMVAVEALQNGSLILHTDIPALNEVLLGDEYSYSYKPYDYLSFSKSMDAILKRVDNMPSLEVMKARADSAKIRFGEDSFVERYISILSKKIKV